MRSLCLFIIALMATTTSAAPPTSQHALTNEGERFAFTRRNMVVTDGAMAKFDRDAMRLRDDSTTAAGAFYLHFPMLLCPWTKYVLSYSATVEACVGPAPYVELAILDENFDPARQVRQEIAKGDKRELAFTTGGDEAALVLYIWSTANGTCETSVRDVVLEQVGDAGATAPPLSRVLDAAGESGKAELPTDAARAEICVELSGQLRAGSVEVRFDWTMSDGSTAAERLVLAPVLGVREHWNGTRAEWYRPRGGPLDAVPHRCELLAAVGLRTTRMSVRLPPGASAVTVTTKRSPDLEGGLRITQIVVATRAADARSTDHRTDGGSRSSPSPLKRRLCEPGAAAATEPS